VARDVRQREEVFDDAPVELGLKGPVEAGHRLADLEAASLDAPFDAALALEGNRLREQPLDGVDLPGVGLGHPGQVGIEIEPLQSESFEVLLDALAAVCGGAFAGSGHGGSPGEGVATPRRGSASYSARSRGSVPLCATA